MLGLVSSIARAASYLASAFNTLASWARSRADQNTGRALQRGDDAQATITENVNAAIDADKNRALSRAQLIDSLRGDGAGQGG